MGCTCRRDKVFGDHAAVVIRPIFIANVTFGEPQRAVRSHRMPSGELPGVGTGTSVYTPAVVMRPILLLIFSVNHSAPSGPVVMK